MLVRAVILIFCLVQAVVAQQPPQDKIRAAMQASLDQQKASVRRQVETAVPVPQGTFFTIPWPNSPASLQNTSADIACDPIPDPELTPLIEAAAKREDLQPELIR